MERGTVTGAERIFSVEEPVAARRREIGHDPRQVWIEQKNIRDREYGRVNDEPQRPDPPEGEQLPYEIEQGLQARHSAGQ